MPHSKEKVTTQVSAKIPRIMSYKDLLSFLKLDSREWEILKVEYGKSEGYRKDRQVKWEVKDGKVKNGYVNDSGKLLIEPLFSVKVTLRRKIEEIIARNEVAELKREAKNYAPKYKPIKYKRLKNGLLYELAMPDLQLGRLVMAEEAGLDSNPEMYVKRADAAVRKLLEVDYPISRILFPIGNDFFNSNSSENMTAHGTPQRDDVRWQRTYSLAKKTMVGLIETMSLIAPVDVFIVKGNHDEERIYYFGDTLESWFRNNKNVKVDNSPKGRKYYSFGKVLLGFAHGYYERENKLDALMGYEVPQLWANSEFREYHLGDKHHKKDSLIFANEMENGVVVRILRSLASPSVWEYDKGFVGSLKAAEGFLWSGSDGLLAQFTSRVKLP
jgi:hypothetical protein